MRKTKKLNLTAETIRRLTTNNLSSVNGGLPKPETSNFCPTYDCPITHDCRPTAWKCHL